MIRTVDLDGVLYTLTPHARRGRRRVLRCEPPLGAPIPDYALRVRLRARVDARAVLVFTDASRSAEVWWDGSRERVRRPGEPDAPSPPASRAMRGCAAVPAAVLEAAGLGSRADPFAALAAALPDPSGPATVRAVWRAAAALRVLDPRCGRGEWLAEAMEALECVYAACLEQMGVWVEEVALAREARRPEYLRDFRAALARGGAVGERILLCNLHGVAEDERAAASARARLHRRLGKGLALPAASIRVRAGEPAHGFASRSDLARALVGLPDAADTLRRLREETESLSRTDALLRAARLAGKVGDDSLVRGLRAVEARRAPLRRRLDALAFRAAGGDPADSRARRRWLADHRPLHAFLEWPERFHLVRGEGP